MTAAEPDWLGAARRAAAAIREHLRGLPGTAERLRETGTQGEGGDRTLEIDAAAEDAVFAELERLHAQGACFTALSEERGEVDFGSPDVRVVIDPIDGSVNAKRGVSHHALSIAVARGSTMADVEFGFVHDFGPGEEWVARRGAGAWLQGVLLAMDGGERRVPDGRLEVLGVESADPSRLCETARGLAEAAYRIRSVGAIAVTLCQVAAARFDGMINLNGTRSVDAAAAQLIVRESGGLVAFPGFEDPLGAPLDLTPHSPVVAARTEAALAELARIVPSSTAPRA